MEFVRKDQGRKEGRKNSVTFSTITQQDQGAKNVILSGKDACKRGSITGP